MLQAPSNNASIDDIYIMIAPIASKYGVERIYLFGSRARGDNTDDSDYDFLVSLGAIKDMVQLGCFIDDLSEVLRRDVDVISDRSTDQNFIKIIRNEGILIYES